MSEDGLLSKEALTSITGKRRPSCQAKWFKNTYGVELPYNSERVIISPALHEQLQARRAGLTAEPQNQSRPQIYSLRSA